MVVILEKVEISCVNGLFIVISMRYNRQEIFLTSHFLEDLV